LKPAAVPSEEADAAVVKSETQEPEATPSKEADPPKANENADEPYPYTEALREKLARINLKSITEEDDHG
jgi:hypothetical protein